MRNHFAYLCMIAAWIAYIPVTTVADDAASPVERLTTTHFPKFFLSYSPDGSHLAYCRHHRNLRGTNQILVGLRIMKAGGKDDRAMLSEFSSAVQIQEHPAWSPDGTQLLISGGGNDTGNSSKDTFVCDVAADFQATQLRKIVEGQGVQLGEEPCFSPDGKHIAFTSVDERIWMANIDGSRKTEVVQMDGSYCHQPAWSPDGKWIAFASDRDGDVEIYKVRWDGSDLTRLTHEKGFDCRPRWSPDGRWILFTSNRNGNHDLFLMHDDGFDVQALTHDQAMDDHGVFSPDGRWVSFVSMRDGGFDIYRRPIPEEIEFGPPPEVSPLRAESTGGLVAHYAFDEVDGTDGQARDSAKRNHLQLFGAKITRDSDKAWLEFDGNDDYALAGNSVQLRQSGPLTLSLWVSASDWSGNGYLLSKHGWNIYVSSDGRPRFETRTADNQAWDTLAAVDSLPLQQWSMVTAVFAPDVGQLSIYINGQLSAEHERIDGALGAVDAFPLQLGHYTVSQTQRFRGRLDEVRIYDVALSTDQISREYTEQSRLTR